MATQKAESKRLLSYDIADWACALKYEHLSPEAIQAAKLFWFDSIGCALGGSQQDDAKILLKHYQAMTVAGVGDPGSYLNALSNQIGRNQSSLLVFRGRSRQFPRAAHHRYASTF